MKKQPTFRRAARGFTLLEIVIVIALIGLILGVVATKIMGSQKPAEYRLAGVQVETIASKIDQYEADTGKLPNSLDNLVTSPSYVSGWLGPYARAEDLNDPWHTPLQYRKPGADGKRFQVVSLGGDRAPGGESTDADIVKP